jgi:hypothetical protein
MPQSVTTKSFHNLEIMLRLDVPFYMPMYTTSQLLLNVLAQIANKVRNLKKCGPDSDNKPQTTAI